MPPQLRPTLRDAEPGKPCMQNGTAYMMILSAVRDQKGLIHGKLENASGEVCAIGSYFNLNYRTCLERQLIDEVAAVNDSVPHFTRAGRRLHVMRWLKWKLQTLGMKNV